MDEVVEDLLPALRQLHAEGDVHDALRLVEAIHDLLSGTAGASTAAALLDVGGGLDGEPVAALACLATARALFDDEGLAHGVGSCDVVAADIVAASAGLEQAVGLYEQGLGLLDTAVDPTMAGRGWHNFGILLGKLGRPAESLQAQQRALAAYRQAGLAVPTADCHVGIGIALCHLGKPGEALEPYAEARALYREFDEESLLAGVDDRRGLALCELGRYEEAEAAHAAATVRYERLGDDYCAARSRRYRSHPLDHADRREEAVAELQAARSTFAELDDELEVARCDAGLAAALMGLGQQAAARALLDNARRALEAHDEEQEAQWCAGLLADPSTLAHSHP